SRGIQLESACEERPATKMQNAERRMQSAGNAERRFVRKDRLSKERRRWNMSRIRGKNTTPAKVVRSLLHGLGYRFRLHGKKLTGRLDIVLAKHKSVIFVHGCFDQQIVRQSLAVLRSVCELC